VCGPTRGCEPPKPIFFKDLMHVLVRARRLRSKPPYVQQQALSYIVSAKAVLTEGHDPCFLMLYSVHRLKHLHHLGDEVLQQPHAYMCCFIVCVPTGTQLKGVPNNVEFLKRLVRDPRFIAGDTTTKFLEGFTFAPRVAEVILPGGCCRSQKKTVCWGVGVTVITVGRVLPEPNYNSLGERGRFRLHSLWFVVCCLLG
jgi:hypothetical protein